MMSEMSSEGMLVTLEATFCANTGCLRANSVISSDEANSLNASSVDHLVSARPILVFFWKCLSAAVGVFILRTFLKSFETMATILPDY